MKKFVVALTLLSALSLVGCGNAENYWGEKMFDASTVSDDEAYLEYIGAKESGKLGEDGRYIVDATEDYKEEDHGPVHVTFAENNGLSVDILYHGEDGRILGSGYFYPGDTIYATVSVDDEAIGKTFELLGFNIYEYTGGSERTPRNSMAGNFAQDGLVLKIPEDFSGTELAIEPVGQYHPRVLSLHDYYLDDSGKENILDGTWTINGQESTGSTTEVNPTASHIISYEYDRNEYFYMTSEPSAQYVSNEYGLVVFDQNVTPEADEYSVGLHKYIEVSVISDTDRELTVNGGAKQSIKANARISTPKMKYGDQIVIETTKEWAKLENNSDLVLSSQERLDNGTYRFRYTMVLPEPNSNFEFDPSLYAKRENGTLSFKCMGEEVTDKIYPSVGRKIYYEEKRADTGYWLPEGDHYIEVKANEAETVRQLEDIQFEPQVPVSVTLRQPEYGGTITYMVNGKPIMREGSYSTYSGAVITMDFDSWEGWMTVDGVYNGMPYNVDEEDNQTLTIGEEGVDQVFQEDSKHKPALTVTLDKSVGSNMKFDCRASGFIKEGSYESKWLQSKFELVKKQQIGTEQGVFITMSGRAISQGEAVKFTITKSGIDKANHDKKITPVVETRLAISLTDVQAPIEIYSADQIAGSTIWYDSIEIEISVVSVDQYHAFDALPNSSITVTDNARNKVLEPGDRIESNQKVTVSIQSSDGYYISGKNVTGDIYQAVMSYSDYVKKAQNIIDTHPPLRYCRLTLDASDTFASYSYTLDGVGKSGTIMAKAGQKLELTYEIREGTGHQLKDPAGGFLFWGKSNTKVTESIKITDDMDGKIISRQNFGIEVN